jgi:predicted O-linked N-acetylglucosamine transferase (SPINDLY family)
VAPVQLIYLGYPNSSGLPSMDFRIGDSFADLEEFANQNSEHVLRLPHASWNYRPWDDMPLKRRSSACQANGFVTFGSANNHAKLQPEWLAVWAMVLKRIPDSRLVLKSRALQSSQIVNDVLAVFERNSVNRSRIDLKHYSASRSDHWQEISKFDVALDSFPYNGTTTTCDSLWLGVPVITRSGSSHVSRTTASILHTLELDDWIADSDDQFIDLCAAKAADLAALTHLQFSLQDRMKNSSLIDSRQFMPDFEKVLREAWTIHCADETK